MDQNILFSKKEKKEKRKENQSWSYHINHEIYQPDNSKQMVAIIIICLDTLIWTNYCR